MAGGRKYAGRAGVLLFAVALVGAGCGGGADGGAPDPRTPEERTTVDPTPAAPGSELECGAPFSAKIGGTLTLTGRFPVTARVGERAVTGTVDATSSTAVRGVVGPGAEVFLVRHGRIVTVPTPRDGMGIRWDLSPGQVERLTGEASLLSCEPTGGTVPAGIYQLYARLVLTPDDGPPVASFGGPWPLDLR